MVFGYSTNAYVKFGLEEAIERIARLGFKGIEILCDRPHLYPPDFDAEKLDRIKRLIQTHDLSVTNLNSFTLFAVGDTYLPSFIEPEKERRDIRIQHTLNCIQTAKKLSCRRISIPPGGPIGNLSDRKST
ncbi:MAG: sugar phosphate isomerase/epimerase, partial [Desulfobacteraceae bacterium]